MTLVERLPWYDAAEIKAREERTERARQRVIEGRQEIDRVGGRMELLRESALRAGVRLTR